MNNVSLTALFDRLERAEADLATYRFLATAGLLTTDVKAERTAVMAEQRDLAARIARNHHDARHGAARSRTHGDAEAVDYLDSAGREEN